MQKQDKYLKMKKFSFPKLFQIFPKAVRTRTNKGSLIGQLNIFIKLSFFYDATTLVNTEKMEGSVALI